MGNSSRFLGFSLLLVFIAATACSVHAMTCQQAMTSLLPCLPFLKGSGASPTAPCCKAVANLNAAAKTTKARRELCKCFKKAIPSFGVDPGKAKQLPNKCHVKVPVPIDPSINCKNIPY